MIVQKTEEISDLEISKGEGEKGTVGDGKGGKWMVLGTTYSTVSVRLPSTYLVST